MVGRQRAAVGPQRFSGVLEETEIPAYRRRRGPERGLQFGHGQPRALLQKLDNPKLALLSEHDRFKNCSQTLTASTRNAKDKNRTGIRPIGPAQRDGWAFHTAIASPDPWLRTSLSLRMDSVAATIAARGKTTSSQ